MVRGVTQDEEDKEKTCQEILGLLQSCVSDPHPRVRYAVIYTIGQMALAFEVSRAMAKQVIRVTAKIPRNVGAGRKRTFRLWQRTRVFERCVSGLIVLNREFSVRAL